MMSITGGGTGVAVFDAKSYDMHFLKQANAKHQYGLTFFEA